MFLTEEELRELTGYTYNSRQIHWLRSHNWKFEVTAQQKPKVARSYFDSQLGASSFKQTVELAAHVVRPNFNAITQLQR